MRLYKLLNITFLSLICFSFASAQRGIHSDAYGKTVFWKKANVHYQSIKKSISPSGIYSDALGKTVFIGNNKNTTLDNAKLSIAPELVFTNADIDWATIHKDESLPGLKDIFTQLTSEITGYEMILEESLLLEDRLVALYRTGSNFGSYVLCTDLETGEKIWDQSFNLTNDVKIEIDQSVYLRSDGNIEISGMRLLSPLVPNLFPFAIATRKILSPDNGLLIERKYTSFEDGGVICNNPNGQFGRILPEEEDMTYLTSCSYPSTNGEYIQIQLRMDQNGKLIDTIGYVPNLLDGQGIESHKYIESYKLPNNNIVIGSTSTANPTDPNLTFAEILVLSESGDFLERIDISELVNSSTFFDMKVEGEHILLSAISFEDFSDANSFLNHVLILDQNGEVIFSLDGVREIDGEGVKNLKVASLQNNEFLLISSEENHCLKYFHIDNEKNVEHLKTICLEDETWLANPIGMITTNNGDIITSGSWSLQESDVTESFQGTFKMSLNELGVSTSVNNIGKYSDHSLQIYPNPVSSEMTINNLENSDGSVLIYNSLGSIVLKQKMNGQKSKTFNVSTLSEGIYNVVLQDESQTKSSSFIKIINQ